MKALNLINEVDRLFPNDIDLQDKISWLNELQAMIFTDIVKDLRQDIQDVTRDQDTYVISGYTIDDIISLKVNGRLYAKKSAHNYKEHFSYYEDSGAIKIYPLPPADLAGGLEITYRVRPDEITEENAGEIELALDSQWNPLYRFYLLSQVAYFLKDTADYNNHTMRYNLEEVRLRNYVANKKPDTDKGSRVKNYW